MAELVFRNKVGKKISEARWRHLLGNTKYQAVAEQRVYPRESRSPWGPYVWVSTIWNGVDLTPLGGESQVFTVTAFDMPSQIALRTWRAENSARAVDAHEEAVAWAATYLEALEGVNL